LVLFDQSSKASPGGSEVILRNYLKGIAIILAASSFILARPAPIAAQAPAAGQSQPTYTLPEYNSLQAAQAEKDSQSRIKLLDSFVAQYPNSTLMQYIYQMYYQTYYQLKNYTSAIDYADKLVALGDKADLALRVQAIQARVQLFGPAYPKPTPDQLTKERDAAMMGVKLYPDLKKVPDSKVTDDQIKTGIAYLEQAAATASYQMKDYPAAIEGFKMALSTSPNDAVTNYHLGLSYLGLTPPQSLDGFWALARAINLKIPDAGKVKDYLRSRILAYEQPGCDTQVDAQLNEMLQLAANAPDRPATYTIPSHDDLTKISQASTIITVISDLSAGGDKAKMTWLAICGAEFPEVVGKVIESKKSDNAVDLMVFTSANSDEMQAATTANMDVKVWTAANPSPAAGTTPVPPQPDVERFEKDDPVRFSGTVASYDPSPFLLHWDQVKVDPTTIPEKAAPGAKHAPAHKPAPKN
jgi:tetratricopeptide (TPR) repeat protein